MSLDYGTGRQRVASLPVALVLVLHLILVLLWASTGHREVEHGPEQRHFTLTWIPVPLPQKAPPPVPPLPRTKEPAVSAVRPHAPTQQSSSEVAQTSEAETIPGAAEVPQHNAAPEAGAPVAVDAKQMIDIAKRQAGLIDNELRRGKPAPLAPDPDLPIARFRTLLDSAFIDRSTTMVTESQTQPDGVVVYRFRRGGKVWCRQSGGGGPSMMEYSDAAKLAGAGSRGGAGTAGTVTCPSGESGWSRL